MVYIKNKINKYDGFISKSYNSIKIKISTKVIYKNFFEGGKNKSGVEGISKHPRVALGEPNTPEGA